MASKSGPSTEGTQQPIDVVYRRRKRRNNLNDANFTHHDPTRPRPGKKLSWNRSLSTRGRTSIAVGASIVYQPQLTQVKKKGKPALRKGKFVEPPNFDKERLYFQEVDAFELLEESPSPKKVGIWTIPEEKEAPIPDLCPVLEKLLEKWRNYGKLKPSCAPSSTLSKPLETVHDAEFKLGSSIPIDESFVESNSNSQMDDISPFSALLAICGQSAPSMLRDVLSSYSQNIVKIGEGTFGEAFKVGNYVCKIVPFDGDFRVNGEVQKRSEELLEEVLLSKNLNQLRGNDGDSYNLCRTFIESIEFKVCQGPYDATLIRAWEVWDDEHCSDNDHPKEFPETQCYTVFVQEHGGKDLESFVLRNFEEAMALLVQVTAGLAVAESAYEFEHRDLHWGNILVSRSDSVTLQFTLDGRNMFVKTYGMIISIIDFTLSRITTGNRILYFDLSSDPDLFKGPKGDKQSETYRRMREVVTEDRWEGSFPRTNVLWLLYLVDILLLKKSFERTSKDERDLRYLKKRLEQYNSAKEAILDPFFSDLFVEQCN